MFYFWNREKKKARNSVTKEKIFYFLFAIFVKVKVLDLFLLSLVNVPQVSIRSIWPPDEAHFRNEVKGN